MARAPESERVPDFLVLGLGNPGERYRNTRHNLGFRVVDALVRSAGATLRDGPGPSSICPFTEGRVRGILARPMTWMNRSGVAAKALRDRYGGPPLSQLLAVTDDLDLPLGRVRFRRGGSPGGHNGLRSLTEELGSLDFPRLRIGIGRPGGDDREDIVGWVLDPFGRDEWPVVEESVGLAVEGVRTFLENGIEAAMNRFNAG